MTHDRTPIDDGDSFFDRLYDDEYAADDDDGIGICEVCGIDETKDAASYYCADCGHDLGIS